ncbi:uncharacterized protein LOC123498729 [Portunus trituberculatus]|uniref:uncharacterized protein LOC123498729 n=1 Tax=Portunus trituberculatus TaxID=210409 RepID=UPI001E1CB33F|nr:uncharacterized protein LOC123498729 [Portunus trituberculatus]
MKPVIILTVVAAIFAHKVSSSPAQSPCGQVRDVGYKLYSLRIPNTYDVVILRDELLATYHMLLNEVCNSSATNTAHVPHSSSTLGHVHYSSYNPSVLVSPSLHGDHYRG